MRRRFWIFNMIFILCYIKRIILIDINCFNEHSNNEDPLYLDIYFESNKDKSDIYRLIIM